MWKQGWIYIVIAAGWVLLVELTLSDLRLGNRLYFPTVTYDYSLRSTVTSSITRGGIPPHNPFFFAGHLFVMHYHYFWLALCSLAEQMTGSQSGSRHAVVAGTIWSGLGLLALVALYLRFFQKEGEHQIRRRTLLAIALLGVTGLDILPVVFIELRSRGIYADLEWWNDQIAAWIVTSLWTPHHLAGLVACLMGFLVIWETPKLPGWRGRLVSAICAALMFASAVGLSIYVTLVFAVFLTLWMVILFVRKQRQSAALVCVSGLLTVALSLPFLQELLVHEAGGGPGPAAAFPIKFTVRQFPIFDRALNLPPSGWHANLDNLLVLPINYGFELGFFLLVGAIQGKRLWRNRKQMTEQELCSLTMGASSVVVCTFLSSNVLTGNDLGWRGFLIAQVVLLIWGAELLANGLLWSRQRGGSRNRGLIAATLALGFAGSGYALAKIRFYPVISDVTSTPLYGWLSPDRNLGARTFALRTIYEELRHRTPPGAVFQHNPNTNPEDLFHGIYADRQVAADTMHCNVFFGGDAGLCQSRIGVIDGLFEEPKAYQASQIDEVCSRMSIDVLIAKDTDKVWSDPESWIWKRKPLLENRYARAFTCGSATVSRTASR